MINGLSILKLVHVLFAIVAVGYNLTYGVILARAARSSRETRKWVLETIRSLDRIANWAYTGLLITGGGLVTMAHYSWAMVWTSGSALLLVVALGLAHGLYTPTLKKQIKLIDEQGPDSPEFQALDRRGNTVGIALMVIALLIVALMVLKP